MSRLIILRGVSGSGKSTWAKTQNALVVSRDTVRHGILNIPSDEYYAQDKDRIAYLENLVTVTEDSWIAGALKNGYDVIVDDTNIEWKYVKRLAKIGYRYGADVEVKVFDVHPNEAIMHDHMRAQRGGRGVGETIIRKQYDRFKATKSKTLEPVPEVKPYNGTPGMPKAFLVDVDGTLAHMRNRGPFDWKRVGEDEVDEKIVDVVNMIEAGSLESLGNLISVIVMSGRDEACRIETENWLFDVAGVHFDELFMRPEGDMRPDNIVKAELFDTYVRDNYDVQFVIDDRDQVVDMWRRMGLACLQVAPGDF